MHTMMILWVALLVAVSTAVKSLPNVLLLILPSHTDKYVGKCLIVRKCCLVLFLRKKKLNI